MNKTLFKTISFYYVITTVLGVVLPLIFSPSSSLGSLPMNPVRFLNPLVLIPFLLMLISLILFLTTKKFNRFNAFSLSVLWINSLTVIIPVVYLFLSSVKYLPLYSIFIQSFMVILQISLFIAITVLLRQFSKSQNIVLQEFEANHYFKIISPSKRILHLLIDNLVMLFVFSTPIAYLLSELNNKSNTFVVGALICLQVLFYILFESSFGFTPGKILTGYAVKDDNGNSVGPGQIILRSFCRLIPFEALSVNKNGSWHDEISGTNVVQVTFSDKDQLVYSPSQNFSPILDAELNQL